MRKRLFMLVLVFLLVVASFALTATMMMVPQVKAATVTIHDHPTESRIKAKDECLEVINATDGVLAGVYDLPNGHVWLRGGWTPPPDTGSVTVDSTIACSVVYIQYRSSDSNDGVTDIYMDDMVNPIVRIDSYMRSHWYVEIRGLSNTIHTVRVKASDNSDMTGVIVGPHRATPGLGDNDVWYFCFGDSVDWWPMFHHDLSHTGYSTSTAPNTNNTIWSYTTGDSVTSSPAVVEGKVYVGSRDDKVYCLNATTGAFIWSYTTGGDVSTTSPAVADGKVYVGSYDNKTYCLNATTGAFIWSYTTGHKVISSPAVVDGKVFVGSVDSKVYCLDAANGAYIWSYTTGGYVSSSPAVVDGRVYVGSCDGKVYCLDAANGDFIWSYTTGHSYVESSPAVVDGRVYVGSFPPATVGKVHCLDALTGAFIWSYTTGDWVYSSPAVADGKVYVGSRDDKVYCLNATTGAFIWSYTTGWCVFSSPAVADGKVYVGSIDDKVYCLDAANGAFIWSYTTGHRVDSCPAVVDGRVYVGSGDSKIYAFESPPYDVTIEAYCYTEATPVSVSITMDGSPTGYNTPHTFTGLTGTHTFTVPSTDPQGHSFKQWSTGETSTTITVTSGGTYTAYYARINVAITNVTLSKTVVGQGYCMNITVTAENQGTFTETFTVIAYYDNLTIPTLEQWETFWSMGDVNRDGYIDQTDVDLIMPWIMYPVPPAPPECDLNGDGWVTGADLVICQANYGLDIWTYFGLGPPPIGTQRVVELYPGSQTTLTFTWNTTGVPYGNYTITATATQVPGETETTDNTKTDGWVKVSVVGDVSGDCLVTGLDVLIVTSIANFMKAVPEAENPNADVNGDNMATGLDVLIITSKENFMKGCPL